MASASLSFKHLAQSIPSHPILDYDFKTLERLLSNYCRGLSSWALSLGGVLGLWWLSWQLVMAIAIGVAVLVLVYGLQQGGRFSRLNWRRLWHRPHRAAILASVSGAIASFNTYMATTIWAGGHSGLALGMIAQTLGTLALLLVWLPPHPPMQPAATDWHQRLEHLTAADPLKRLLTVRSATDRVMQLAIEAKTAGRDVSYRTAEMARQHLADCLRLMLSQELEPTVRSAVVDSLQRLNPVHQEKAQWGQGAHPLPMSVSAKPQRVKKHYR